MCVFFYSYIFELTHVKLAFLMLVFLIFLIYNAKRCISPPFLFSSPFLISPLYFKTCNPHSPHSPCPSWHSLWENTRFYDDTPESKGLKKSSTKPWKPITYRNCVLSTECVLIDIMMAISIAVGNGYDFAHGEVGTTYNHIKTYDRLTTR